MTSQSCNPLREARLHLFHHMKLCAAAKAAASLGLAAYTSAMGLSFPNQVFRLPNARRMIVEQFGVRITDKQGNTILESGPRKEVCFDRSLSDDDRRLL